MLAALVVAAAGSVTLPVKAAPGGPMGGHGAMGMPMMGGGHIDKMLDSVDASAEQRSQIKQIMEAAATDLKAQREAGRALREQAAQLFTQPTVDARAAEALRQKMVAQHDQASKRTLQAMLDASRVLTPEQRQQMAERLAQRRGMMERHRSERNTLEKPAS